LYLDTATRNGQMIRAFKVALPDITANSQPELEQAQSRYEIASTYMRRGMLEAALSQLLLGLHDEPHHVASLIKAGELSLKLGRWPEALDLSRRALALDPRNAATLHVAGQAAEKLNAHKEAVGFLEQAIALQPNNGEIRLALWRSVAQIQSTAKAR